MWLQLLIKEVRQLWLKQQLLLIVLAAWKTK
jgi:hypothetical protein